MTHPFSAVQRSGIQSEEIECLLRRERERERERERMKRQRESLKRQCALVESHNKKVNGPLQTMTRMLVRAMTDLRRSKELLPYLLEQCEKLLAELSELKVSVEEQEDAVRGELEEVESAVADVHERLEENDLFQIKQRIKGLEKEERKINREGHVPLVMTRMDYSNNENSSEELSLPECQCGSDGFGHATILDCIKFELGELWMQEARYDQTGEWGSDLDDEHAFFLEDEDQMACLKNRIDELEVDLNLAHAATETYENFHLHAKSFKLKLESLCLTKKRDWKLHVHVE